MPETDERVEVVASALHAQARMRSGVPPWDALLDKHRLVYKRDAEAVIAAVDAYDREHRDADEEIKTPEVCVMCGTTAELDSGDCAFCAGREQAEAEAVGQVPKQFVSDRDLLRALVDRGLVVLGHEGLYVNYDAIRAAINREET